MSVLSITFHSPISLQKAWSEYRAKELLQLIENLYDVEKFLLSVVDSDRIEEGENTSLLLVFLTDEKREDFLESELGNIVEHVEKKFGPELLTFVTLLNPISSRL